MDRNVNTVLLALDVYDNMSDLINDQKHRIADLERNIDLMHLKYSDLVHEIRELAKASIHKLEDYWFLSSEMKELLELIGQDDQEFLCQVKADEELAFPWEEGKVEADDDGNS